MRSYNLENLTFLLVEDNHHWQSIERNLLAALSVKKLTVVKTGQDALAHLAHATADIVVCDWMLPEMSGIDLVEQLRDEETSPNPFIPIILLTAHTERTRVEEARDAGVTEVLTKPVSAKALYEHIVSIIERPRQFVRTDTYFGPDRRRRADPNYDGPERRQADAEVVAPPAIEPSSGSPGAEPDDRPGAEVESVAEDAATASPEPEPAA